MTYLYNLFCVDCKCYLRFMTGPGMCLFTLQETWNWIVVNCGCPAKGIKITNCNIWRKKVEQKFKYGPLYSKFCYGIGRMNHKNSLSAESMHEVVVLLSPAIKKYLYQGAAGCEFSNNMGNISNGMGSCVLVWLI